MLVTRLGRFDVSTRRCEYIAGDDHARRLDRVPASWLQLPCAYSKIAYKFLTIEATFAFRQRNPSAALVREVNDTSSRCTADQMDYQPVVDHGLWSVD
jgi:hypothetical protein